MLSARLAATGHRASRVGMSAQPVDATQALNLSAASAKLLELLRGSQPLFLLNRSFSCARPETPNEPPTESKK